MPGGMISVSILVVKPYLYSLWVISSNISEDIKKWFEEKFSSK